MSEPEYPHRWAHRVDGGKIKGTRFHLYEDCGFLWRLPVRVERFVSYAEGHGYTVEVESDEWAHFVKGKRRVGLLTTSFHAAFSAKRGGFRTMTMVPFHSEATTTKSLRDAEITIYVHGNFEGRRYI